MTPETAVKRAIKRYLSVMGWQYYSNLQGLGSECGLADITAWKDGVVIWIEAKSENGRQSERQMIFQRKIEQGKCHYILARSDKDVEEYLINKGIERNRRLL